ncbi:TIM barrel protein [Seonamhaeicola sp.]|uniref:sugar phosphate isomerase/epimerase family protein n=1 Tax=Seonamhaeicola sp. TaxID=1912245 RepID=UPI00262641AA|nr:TIM barrel protein [Seonamhaeicola sp.]
MGKIKIGCETYTWQMAGESYKGKLEHIMGVASKAGFQGIEPETSFFGSLEDPLAMKDVLDKHDLELSVLCHVEDWRYSTESKEEWSRAEKWMDFLSHFPDTIYLLVQMPGVNRNDLANRQHNLISCLNAIAQRAYDRGINSSFHPNSPSGSICREEQDYNIIINALNRDHIGFCPDVGHIAKGGMDPLSIIKKYRDLVNLVHFKDMYQDGRWAPTGKGIIDFKTITQYLVRTDYNGWIILEDECDRAIHEPDAVTLLDGKFVKSQLLPLI